MIIGLKIGTFITWVLASLLVGYILGIITIVNAEDKKKKDE